MLRDAHERAKTLSSLRPIEVYKYVEEYLFGKKYDGEDCEARGQTGPTSENQCRSG